MRTSRMRDLTPPQIRALAQTYVRSSPKFPVWADEVPAPQKSRASPKVMLSQLTD
jgi:hypothetical protein